jgi:hypothetical protein
MFYTFMGYHINADEDNNNNITDLDEEPGMIPIVDDTSPPVQYNDDCNRYESQQQLLNKKNPPPLERAQLKDLYFSNEQGVCEESEEDESKGDDAYTDKSIIDDLENEHEAANPNNNMESEGEDGLEQEHQTTGVSNLIGVANYMLAIVREPNVPKKHEEGTDNDGIYSPESVAC